LREGEGVKACLFGCEVGFFLPFVFGVEVVAGSTAYEDYGDSYQQPSQVVFRLWLDVFRVVWRLLPVVCGRDFAAAFRALLSLVGY